MKDYLVDVPVKINIWIRSECQKRQLEVLRQARPSVIFLISDGGRTEQEWQIINENRAMVEQGIDWNCTVYKLYMDHNNGLYGTMTQMFDFVWSKVDRCIFLEDDDLPAVTFFRFCKELLDRYENDLRICCICGCNILEKWEPTSADYFFSRQGSIWGIATWKRVYEEYNDYEYGKDPYVMNLLRKRTRHNPMFWKRIKGYATDKVYKGHIAGDEFFLEFAVYGRHQLQIVPKYNMISNIGCTNDAEHSDTLEDLPRGVRQMFDMKTYELKEEIKHPKYVIPDEEFEKARNRVVGYNTPFIILGRKIERLMRKLLKGDFKYIFSKLKQRINGEK